MKRYLYTIENGNPVFVVVTMEEPDPKKFAGGIIDHFYCENKDAYNNHLLAAPRIHIQGTPPANWKEGMEYFEGKDFRLQHQLKAKINDWIDVTKDSFNRSGRHEDHKQVVAIPIPIASSKEEEKCTCEEMPNEGTFGNTIPCNYCLQDEGFPYSTSATMFKGMTTGIPGASITNFTVLGYRVIRNGAQFIIARANNIVIDQMEYLDDQKRPLPNSFIVFSYVDTKQ